jgi:hypothetical protein
VCDALAGTVPAVVKFLFEVSAYMLLMSTTLGYLICMQAKSGETDAKPDLLEDLEAWLEKRGRL